MDAATVATASCTVLGILVIGMFVMMWRMLGIITSQNEVESMKSSVTTSNGFTIGTSAAQKPNMSHIVEAVSDALFEVNELIDMNAPTPTRTTIVYPDSPTVAT